MPEWGLLIIQLLIIAAVGLIFWRNLFVCTAGIVGFSIWLVVLSFTNYGDISGGTYAIIMVRRFTCIFAIVAFSIEEIYKITMDDGQIFYIVFTPETFIDAAWKAAVSAAGCLLITDFIIPWIVGDGFFTTFRYTGILGLIFIIPGAISLVIEIIKLVKTLRGY